MSNERERKSVGEQETFEIDTLDATFVLERARALARTVWSRLEGHGFRTFRTVTVTVRFENFITFARSRTGLEAWTSEEALWAEALELLLPFLDDRENPRHRKLRLIEADLLGDGNVPPVTQSSRHRRRLMPRLRASQPKIVALPDQLLH